MVYKYEYEDVVLTATPPGEKYVASVYQALLWTDAEFMKFEFSIDEGH